MKNAAAVFLLGLLTVSCSSNSDVLLRWDLSASQYYRITKEEFPVDMNVDIDAMLNNSGVLKKNIKELQAIPLEGNKLPMQLSMKPGTSGKIEILAKNVKVKYTSPANSENELRRRQQQEKLAGLVQLNTVINESGKNQNQFINTLQRNLVAFIFQLPEKKISVGESWQIPAKLASLNTPFIADSTHRFNKVWIDNISERPGHGRVATVIYILKENITGKRQQIITEEANPFNVTATYFAVGEYLLDARQWLRYTGRLETTIGNYRNTNLIALIPEHEASE